MSHLAQHGPSPVATSPTGLRESLACRGSSPHCSDPSKSDHLWRAIKSFKSHLEHVPQTFPPVLLNYLTLKYSDLFTLSIFSTFLLSSIALARVKTNSNIQYWSSPVATVTVLVPLWRRLFPPQDITATYQTCLETRDTITPWRRWLCAEATTPETPETAPAHLASLW